MFSLNFVAQFLHLLAAAIMMWLARLVFFNKQSSNHTLPFVLFILLFAFDAICIALRLSATVVWQKRLFLSFTTIAIISVIPMWLTFITLYTGYQHWLTRRTKWLIWSIPTGLVLGGLTNYWHQWMFIIETTPVFTIQYAFLAYIGLIYALGAMIYGLVLFWRAISSSKGVLRQQFTFMLVGISLFVLGQCVVYVLTPESTVAYILRPICWIFATISLLIGIYRTQLLDITPLSHKAFFVQVQTGFVACDEMGRIRAVNPAATQILRQSSEQLIGQPYKTAFTVLAKPLTDEMILSGRPFQYETEIENEENDTPVWYRIEGSSLDESGYQPGISIIMHDITQAKEAERLRHSLTRMVYHDLSQPITAILLSLNMVERAYMRQNDEKFHQYLSSSKEGGKHLLNIVTNLRTISQIETNSLQLNRETRNLKVLIEEALKKYDTLAEKQAVSLTCQTTDAPLTVDLDPSLIERVLGNLISNSLRFTPEGGRITVKTEPLKPDDNSVTISVTDTGTGVSADDQERLFKEGVSLGNKKSTGLGLPFCRTVVEAHDGRIWFENVSLGACIMFSLPIKTQQGLSFSVS